MSRCRQTAALLDAVLADTRLTRAQADHAAACAECARALSQARRFERELDTAAAGLATEAMPAPSDLMALASPNSIGGGRSMTRRLSLIGGVAAFAALAALVVSNLGPFASGFGISGIFDTDPALAAWLNRATAAVEEAEGRDWKPVQVERCGATAIAFFEENDAESVRGFRYAVGQPEQPESPATREASSLAAADVAELRATLPVCDLVLDPALDQQGALDALRRARARWDATPNKGPQPPPVPNAVELSEVRLIDSSKVHRDFYMFLLERPLGAVPNLERIVLHVGDDGALEVDHSTSTEGMPPSLVVYRDENFLAPTYFALIDRPDIAAVELIGPDAKLRYTVQPGGFLIEVDHPAGAIGRYRLLDHDGNEVVSGVIDIWQHGR